MRTLFQDLRYGLRVLARSPGFTAVAVLTLALGVGANTAIFQLIDAVRLRALPVKDPQKLATVRIAPRESASGSFEGDYPDLTFPMWQQIRRRQQAFSSIAVWSAEQFNLATGGEVRPAHGIWVSGEFFDVLGVRPILGRLISPADDQPGCGAAGVDISYSFWQREFGGEASAVGKRLTLDNNSFEILGVTPPAFHGVEVGNTFDVAVPICSEPVLHGENSRLNVRHFWWLAAIGRRKPGETVTRATAQLNVISPAVLQETIPPFYDAGGAKHYLAYRFAAFPAYNGFSELRRDSSTPLWLLLGISGLVLLIACVNLANLLLARAGARERELAVRLALGASRRRLVRQMLSESLLLAVVGTICGALLAGALSEAVVSLISTPGSSVFLDLTTDWRVLGFAAGLAILTTLLFGLVPAVRASAAAPADALKAAGRGRIAGRERFGLQKTLVASQVALSLVLLVGALLFVRSLRNLLTLDPGFQQDGILVTNADFTRLNLPADRRADFGRQVLDRVRTIPGVESAAGAMMVPLGGSYSNDYVQNDASEEHRGVATLNFVSPGYFRTLETPLLAGRDFAESDTAASPKVAIVNQAFVQKFLGGNNPLVQRFRIWEPPGKPEPFFQVVGVVKDTKYQDLHENFGPIMYFPASQQQNPRTEYNILIRSNSALPSLISSMRSRIAGISPEVDIEFTVFKTRIRESLVQDQLMATLSGFFGLLAALLAAIGIYGVISYKVAQRTSEIGIRLALGAQPTEVVRLILREAGILIAIGLAAGTGIALAAAQAASSLLFGMKSRDPVSLGLALVLLALVGLLASFLPAYRASRLDPMVALRYE